MEDFQEFLANFKGNLEPVKISITYRIALFLVAMVMILLPIIYLVLIAGIGYLVFVHIRYDVSILFLSRWCFGLILYIAPIIIGGILIYYMIKPVFNKISFIDHSIEITAEEAPLLFALIQKMSAMMNSPLPTKVFITSEVNAFAGFNPGLLSIFRNELLLTIGSPLIYTMNIQQIAGILAHEFGHFAQRAGLRLSSTIRYINFWFVRVVYERESLDKTLVRHAEQSGLWMVIILNLARISVWLTSIVLSCLMRFGNVVSGFLLRQLEYDADCYEIRLSGSDSFIDVRKIFRILNHVQYSCISDLETAWQEKKLVNNYPKYLSANFRKHKHELSGIIEEEMSNEKTGLFDTHPCDKDRITNAQKENSAGLFLLTEPATRLFIDFDTIAKKSTLEFFKNTIDPDIKTEQLMDYEDILLMQNKIEEDFVKLTDYTLGIIPTSRPVDILSFINSSPGVNVSWMMELEYLREMQIVQYKKAFENQKEYDQIERKKILFLQADTLLESGFTIDAEKFDLDGANIDNYKQKMMEYLTEQAQLTCLNEYDDIIKKKFGLTFSYFEQHNEQFEPNRFTRYSDLKNIYRLLINSYNEFIQLRDNFYIQGILIVNLKGNETNESLNKALVVLIQRSYDLILILKEEFKSFHYPYDQLNKKITLSDYLFSSIIDNNEQNEIYLNMRDVYEKYFSLYSKIVAEFADLAVMIESSLGLEPLHFVDKEPTVLETPQDLSRQSPGFLEKYVIHLIGLFIIAIGLWYLAERLDFTVPHPNRVTPLNNEYEYNSRQITKSSQVSFGNYAILYMDKIENEEIYLRLITVSTYAEAYDILKQLEIGLDFKQLAVKNSLHPSNIKEGDIGKYKLSDLNPLFQDAVRGLNAGEFSKIIEFKMSPEMK